jgi:hypothetical protein
MVGKPISSLATLFVCAVIAVSIQAQTGRAPAPFVRDANSPFVYLKFDHIGTGIRRSDDEPSSRIWLRFVNNCNVQIVLHAYGVPDKSPAGEVGIMDNVVPDPPMLTITSAKPVIPAVEHHRSQMPSGYVGEVAGAIRVEAGESVLFSVPTNHLGAEDGGWHMEIPFWFATPKGNASRAPGTGGEPVMSLWYSLYDVPHEARAAVPEWK